MTRVVAALRRQGVLLLILAVAATVRLWGIGFGLPHPLCRPDEDSIVSVAVSFFNGNFHPHFFNYPAFFMFVVAGGFVLFHGLGRMAGWFTSRAQFLQVSSPAGLHLTARLCSAAAGIGTVWVLHQCARRLFGRRCAPVSAFFLALAFLHVRDSHFGVTDIAATFLIVTAFLFAVRLAESGSLNDLVGSAVMAGLATSTKYNAALVALPPLWALTAGDAARRFSIGARAKRWAIFGAIMVAAFVAGSPYSVLAYRDFIGDLASEAGHLAAGHAVIVGRGWMVHLASSLRHGLGTPLLVLGMGGLAILGWREPRKAVLVALFPVAYFAVIGSGYTVFVRYTLPVVPFLCLSAAYAVTTFVPWLTERHLRPAWAAALTWLGAIVVIAPSAWSVVRFDGLLATDDSRLMASRWIEQQFPAGAVLLQVGPLGGHVFFPTESPGLAQRYVTIEADVSGRQPDIVVIQVSPIDTYAVPPEDEQRLTAGFELRRVFHAFNPEVRGNVYDRQDEFYVPLAGFRGIERPGPNLKVYVRR